MDECIFCKIVGKQIPADVQYEDEYILVFKDITPKAPVHWLIIPKKHVLSIQELTAQDANLAGRLLLVIPELANKAGVAESGYRILSSVGQDGGQEVSHMHIHLLGGKKLAFEV